MPYTLRELAELVQGEFSGTEGDLLITGAKPLSEAGPGQITYVEGPKQLPQWQASKAAAAVVLRESPLNDRPTIRVADPLMAFATIVDHFRGISPLLPDGRIDPTARIHPSATIAPGCTIGAYAVIGEGTTLGRDCYIHPHVVIGRHCHLGERVTLHPQVVLYDETRLGHRVIIHSHTVIGSDGFGYRTIQGLHQKVPQVGNVEVGDDVEIGACTTIDRGTFGSTRIGSGTKLDNLIQIGHNCQIGPGNIFAAHVGISGSVTTGAYVVMAGQVGIGDHVQIGDGAVLGAKTGVHSNLDGGVRYLGAPAIPIDQELRIIMTRQKLPLLKKDLKRALKALGLQESDS